MSGVSFELFDPLRNPKRRLGRLRVRAAALTMIPTALITPLLLPSLEDDTDTLFWGLRAPDDTTLVLRTASFATATAARADATDILTRSTEMQLVPVHDPTGAHHSLWIALNGHITLVAATSWDDPDSTANARILRELAGSQA